VPDNHASAGGYLLEKLTLKQRMKKRILVVDDDPSVRESLKKILEDSGYQVAVGADGEEAEAQLDETDLLILDMNMPRRDGWDVLGRVSSRNPLLPVIVVTGMMDQLDTTIIPGVSALLKKPVEATVILKTIETVLAEPVEERLRRTANSQETAPWARINSWRNVERPATPPRPAPRLGGKL